MNALHRRDAKKLTDAEIVAELNVLEAKFRATREGDGHGGSPGEWLVERMSELETEQKRRRQQLCTFHFDHDPVTLAPRGRACEALGVEEIHWKDGRVSIACKEHGVDALTKDAKAEVRRVVPLPQAGKRRRAANG
jgi:hypothetical protein